MENKMDEKTERLIALGAAIAANCIPCFEHLYESSVTSGITASEIKRAADIAGRVKKGANNFLVKSVEELTGDNTGISCVSVSKDTCCC